MGFFTVSRQLSPRQAVSPITLPGTAPPTLRLDSQWKWYHIRTEKLCYQSQFFPSPPSSDTLRVSSQGWSRVTIDTTVLKGATRLHGMKIALLGPHTSTETGRIGMEEATTTEQLRLLQQEIVLAGEAVETLKRDQRAAIAALRLEVEVLKRCLFQVHPELAAQFEAIRATLIREFDPESS